MENLLTVSLIPIFLIFVLVEYLYLKRKKLSHLFRLNDTITNLNIGVGHLLTRLFLGFILIGAYNFFYSIAPIKLPNNIWTWVACFILYDFFFYWAHRWGHEVNLFWAAHSVHHQSEEYNLSVALRQSWLHAILAFVIFLPVPFMGMPVEIFFINAAISGLYQFWIHTEVIIRMPKWFEYIFNTPSHHRVHHAVNPEYIDKNHGATLIIWDRIFGTYAEEVKHPSYGVTKPISTWNPLWSNLIYFSDLWKASKSMKWKDKAVLIFKKPGWRPEYLGGMMSIPEVDENVLKYNATPVSSGLSTYVLIQFVLIVFGTVGFIYYFNEFNTLKRISGFITLLLSITICGAILEQKSWVKYAEYFRLLVALLVVNNIYYINFQDWFKITLIASIIVTIYMMVWYTLNSWLNLQFTDWVKDSLKK
ncbi:MAG TPA: sterol desaturase family protein [Chitinophagales bacterium]|nr:sterol desaturase family protein [Chitinophagales bacterium]